MFIFHSDFIPPSSFAVGSLSVSVYQIFNDCRNVLPPVMCNPITHNYFFLDLNASEIIICFVKRFLFTFHEKFTFLFRPMFWQCAGVGMSHTQYSISIYIWRFEHCVHSTNLFLLIALDEHTFELDCFSIVFWIIYILHNKQQQAMGPWYLVYFRWQILYYFVQLSIFHVFHFIFFSLFNLIDSIAQFFGKCTYFGFEFLLAFAKYFRSISDFIWNPINISDSTITIAHMVSSTYR